MNNLSCCRKRMRKLVLATILILLCGTCLFFCTKGSRFNHKNNLNPWSNLGFDANGDKIDDDKIVSVHFLDIGKADCILIKIGEKAVLIDSGTSEKVKDIIDYLKKQKVTKLDYAVATHCDKDHVGGMSEVLKKFPTSVLLMSARGKNTKPYQAMIETAKELKVTQIIPKVNTVFYVGNVKFSVLAPGEEAMAAGTDNESSIVLMMQYGEKKFLFMGDAMEVSEHEMLQNGYDLRADVIKVGHHGSKRCTGEKFLDTVNPAVAVITCEEGDGTSLPEKETLEVINEQHILLYRTDKDGTIVMTTNGIDIRIDKDST